MSDGLDPRFDWIEMRSLCDPEPHYIRGQCLHLEIAPVESVEGEHVANLCLTCDQQFPVEQAANFGG